MAAKKFTIQIQEPVLTDLKDRLSATRWPDEPEDAGWSMGTNTSYLKELVDYWRDEYDWRAREAEMNKLPQFVATIAGRDIHFVHVKSKHPNAKPLLLLHGWPDTFYRYHKVIPMLADPEAHGGKPEDAFDVVVPSLPGFGFSTRDTISSSAAAGVFTTLMTKELGYGQYMVAGGDLGATVAMAMALQNPDVVAAMHLMGTDYPSGQEDPATLSKDEQEFAQFTQKWLMSQGAYSLVHGTKPQSLAPALNDSPAGLASWIISFIDSGAQDHNVEAAVGGRDDLLTLITISWVTQTAGSAARVYLLDAVEKYAQPAKSAAKSTVPVALAVFPRDALTPEDWARRTINLQRYRRMERGGHLAPLELPDEYAGDLQQFFAAYR